VNDDAILISLSTREEGEVATPCAGATDGSFGFLLLVGCASAYRIGCLVFF